eukprot:10816710-Karenia_brevis.AAC.1
MVTCVECGHGEKKKTEEKPQFKFEDCPHEELDRRGSNKSYCCPKAGQSKHEDDSGNKSWEVLSLVDLGAHRSYQIAISSSNITQPL